MNIKIKLAVIAIFAISVGVFFVRPGQTQTKVKTAGEVYKNIKVLNDLPADQLINVMQFFNGSLGVNCNFCHVPNEWAKDDKEEKGAARNMIKMTLGINKDNFDGRLEVSCATCHNGRSHPAGMP